MEGSFSIRNRTKILESMENEELDVLIIGGGITGAGIALDAQAQGLNCGLVEMQDFAEGTSSRSTKLIHGGLRYLKQFDWKLVAEVGRERAIVHHNAPHVTEPMGMLLPVIKGGTYGKWATNIGLLVYDTLAKVIKSERRKMLTKKQTLEKVPHLAEDGLKGSGYYVEYRTDDSRLTMEVLKKAVELGANAVNYSQVTELLYADGIVIGVKVEDNLNNMSYQIKAKKVVNAAGPWVDELRGMDGSLNEKHLLITKGVHIVVSKEKFPLDTAVYFDVFKDKRMIFAIPRDGVVYIGTTDTIYEEKLENPSITKEDRNYLIDALKTMFPSIDLSEDDIQSSWSGLRPLIHEEGKDPSEISRKDEVFLSDTGLITIAGGKLTGYRMMAHRVVEILIEALIPESRKKSTKEIKLSGGDVAGPEGYLDFIEEAVKAGVDVGLDEDEASQLIRRFGSNVFKIFEIVREGLEAEEELTDGLQASLIYCMEEEMASNACDYFIRRTSELYFDIAKIERWGYPVLQYMRQYLGWSEEEFMKQRNLLIAAVLQASGTDLGEEWLK